MDTYSSSEAVFVFGSHRLLSSPPRTSKIGMPKLPEKIAQKEVLVFYLVSISNDGQKII